MEQQSQHNISNMVEFTVEPGEGDRRLDTFLHHRLLSAKAIRALKHHGTVLVNGEPSLLKGIVREGDQIRLFYPVEEENPYLQPEELPLDIIYEDKDILVVNKQAHVCVHPTKGHPHGSLASGVMYYWQQNGENAVVHLINRLDMDTSGLVLIAKNTYCAQQFFCQQVAGQVSRHYCALAGGVIPDEQGIIDLPIIREEGRTIRRKVSPEGQRSITHYRVAQRFLHYTLLDLWLETGRTHQIRVHFSHLGYPLVGDSLYGGETGLLDRQFLHAVSLSFFHPILREEMDFHCSLPLELAQILKVIGGSVL